MSSEDEAQREIFRISSARVVEIIDIEGRAAWKRADAWAHSVPGTPYGSTEPVLSGEQTEFQRAHPQDQPARGNK